MACGLTALGQFIPQPNAYNPDANGDSFIGVDDVMGTLALFGNAFETSDSLQSLSLEFSQESIQSDGPGTWENPYQLPEGIDVLVVHSVDVEHVHLNLPSGTGFHSLLIMTTTENPGPSTTSFSFYGPANDDYVQIYGDDTLETLHIDAYSWHGRWGALLRSPSGQWLVPRGW